MSKLILIGGMPGSGKSYIGKEIAKEIGLYVDKDTVSRFFTESLLDKLGSTKDDRESEIYLMQVRDLEYETMFKIAYENLQLGHSVICSAPFIREFISTPWQKEMSIKAQIDEFAIIFVWINVDKNTAKQRLVSRGASRDSYKIAHWHEYEKDFIENPPKNIPNLNVIENTEMSKTTLSEQIEKIIEIIKNKDIA